MFKKFLIIPFIMMVVSFLAVFSSANFGCWQFYDKYKVLLSSSPLAPYEGQEAQMLFSITKDDQLVKGDLPAKIIFLKNGEEKGIIDIQFEEGVTTIKHAFSDAGLYEIDVEFFIDGETITMDFPYEVKERVDTNSYFSIISLIIVFLMGILLGFSCRKFRKKK